MYQKYKSKLSTLGALFLILACPPTVMLFWYTNVYLNGSFSELFQVFSDNGLLNTVYDVWSPVFFGSPTAWAILGIYAAIQLTFIKILPGKLFKGPITPKGNIPIYKDNGVLAYFSTLGLFALGSYFNVFSPTIIYDHFGELLGALNFFSLLFCVFLYLKGHIAPTTTDCGSNGNIIYDYYWGMELYPRILGWDVKLFTNCRMAMMAWPLIILSFAAKQHELYGLSNSMVIAVALQLIYVTKFFFWEKGYLCSLDIMHDRAGFYICWAILVWLPGIYTSPTLYLVNHPNHLSTPVALLILTVGAASIIINYWADYQRQLVRKTNGQCTIFGKTPSYTVASYVTTRGEVNHNILLHSGWWGISRHFHYVPEIIGAFCWSVPALFEHFMPYFYVVFLTILLVERAFRDDVRCANKYGEGWDSYCKKVPHKIIPYVI